MLFRSPKITYFPMAGRAEPARLALYIGGIDFDDDRIDGQEFGRRKQEGAFPYGSVPVLTVGDLTVAQSNNILRYCGKLTKLYPEDNLLAARVDELLDACEDLSPKIFGALFEKDEEKKKELLSNLNTTLLPQWVGFLEKRVGDNGFSVGNSLTISDLKLYNVLAGIAFNVPFYSAVSSSAFENAPKLKAIFGNVHSHPKVSEWNKNVNKF